MRRRKAREAVAVAPVRPAGAEMVQGLEEGERRLLRRVLGVGGGQDPGRNEPADEAAQGGRQLVVQGPRRGRRRAAVPGHQDQFRVARRERREGEFMDIGIVLRLDERRCARVPDSRGGVKPRSRQGEKDGPATAGRPPASARGLAGRVDGTGGTRRFAAWMGQDYRPRPPAVKHIFMGEIWVISTSVYPTATQRISPPEPPERKRIVPAARLRLRPRTVSRSRSLRFSPARAEGGPRRSEASPGPRRRPTRRPGWPRRGGSALHHDAAPQQPARRPVPARRDSVPAGRRRLDDRARGPSPAARSTPAPIARPVRPPPESAARL